jgi:hypothetical protein
MNMMIGMASAMSQIARRIILCAWRISSGGSSGGSDHNMRSRFRRDEVRRLSTGTQPPTYFRG